MEHATQLFAAVSLLVIALSHLFQPKAWVAWFQALGAMGVPGAFTEGFLSLSFGAIIVGFHNVWHGPAIGLTLIGWGQIIKAMGRFVAPNSALKIYAAMTLERAWLVRAGGVFAMILSGYCWWLRFWN